MQTVNETESGHSAISSIEAIMTDPKHPLLHRFSLYSLKQRYRAWKLWRHAPRDNASLDLTDIDDLLEKIRQSQSTSEEWKDANPDCVITEDNNFPEFVEGVGDMRLPTGTIVLTHRPTWKPLSEVLK